MSKIFIKKTPLPYVCHRERMKYGQLRLRQQCCEDGSVATIEDLLSLC